MNQNSNPANDSRRAFPRTLKLFRSSARAISPRRLRQQQRNLQDSFERILALDENRSLTNAFSSCLTIFEATNSDMHVGLFRIREVWNRSLISHNSSSIEFLIISRRNPEDISAAAALLMFSNGSRADTVAFTKGAIGNDSLAAVLINSLALMCVCGSHQRPDANETGREREITRWY